MAFGGLPSPSSTVATTDEGRAGTRRSGSSSRSSASSLASSRAARILGVGVPAARGRRSRTCSRSRTPSAATIGSRTPSAGRRCIVGAYFAFRGSARSRPTRGPDLNPWIGAMLKNAHEVSDVRLHARPHRSALAPWSAFAPFAFGRMFIAPRTPLGRRLRPRERDPRSRCSSRRRRVRRARLDGGAHRPRRVRARRRSIAAACGVALRDYERGAHPSVAVGVGTAVLPRRLPPRAAQPPRQGVPRVLGAAAASSPRASRRTRSPSGRSCSSASPGSRSSRWSSATPSASRSRRTNYLRVLIALRDAWDGMLALAYFAMVAGASLAGLAVWIGSRQHAHWLPTLSLADARRRAQRVVGHCVRSARRHLRRLLLVRRLALGVRPLRARSRKVVVDARLRAVRGRSAHELKSAGLVDVAAERSSWGASSSPRRISKHGIGPTALLILAPLHVPAGARRSSSALL